MVSAPETSPLLGLGLYTVPEAARILQLDPRRLRRWFSGYVVRSHDARRVAPVIAPQLGRIDGEDILTFPDLIELYFVALFARQGVSLPAIRAAASRARKLFQTDQPFAVKQFQTDGKRIFAELAPEDVEGVPATSVLEELQRGQTVITEITQPFFLKLEYEADLARRWWPLGKERGIVLDAARMFGQPIHAASGVPTDALYRMVRAGESPERTADWFGVDLDAVYAAMEYEAERAARPA